MWIWRCMMKWSDTFENSQPLVVLSSLLLDRTGPIGPLCLAFLCKRGGSGHYLLCPLQLTPSLPQPVKFPGWKVHICTPAYRIISSPITNLLSVLFILAAVLPHTNGGKNWEKKLNLLMFSSRFLLCFLPGLVPLQPSSFLKSADRLQQSFFSHHSMSLWGKYQELNNCL